VVGDIQRHAFGFPRDAGIARRAPEFCYQRGSRDLPRQSVFAAAGTEQEDVHAISQTRFCRLSVARVRLLLQGGKLIEHTVIPDGA
jgi:hypothetical protein